MKEKLSKYQFLETVNAEFRLQAFYKPGQEITDVSSLSNGVLVLHMPTDGTDFSMLGEEYQAWAHSLSEKYQLIGE